MRYVKKVGRKIDERGSTQKIFGSASGPSKKSLSGKCPACPADLSGILTYQLMDPKYIGGMIPLGNVSPPGHTSPVDHIYFSVNTDQNSTLCTC